MIFGKIVGRKTYFGRIFQWLTIAMLLPLTLYSSTAYYNVKKTVLNKEVENNNKIFQQIGFNIDFMNDMIENFILNNFNNRNVSPIMYDKDVNLKDAILVMNEFENASLNPFVQSIYIYNNQTQTYYSSSENLVADDLDLTKLFHSNKEIPKMKPIPRNVVSEGPDGTKHFKDVVTYVMYDFKDDYMPKGALIINASTAWLFKNINLINMADRNKQDHIMILDNQGQLIEHDTSKDTFNNALRELYQGYVGNTSESRKINGTGFFVNYIEGQKYLITFQQMDKMKWTLVKAQLYDQVFQWSNTLKLTLILLTLVFIILGFIAARTISGRIYKPIGKLVKSVSEYHETNVDASNDEISYLNEAYTNSIEQLKVYRTKRNSEKVIMKTYFLRKLLIDSNSISTADFTQAQEGNQFLLNPDFSFLVCVVKIDKLAEFTEQFSPKDQSLFRFGISNLSSELVGKVFPNEMIEMIEMKNDYFVMVVNIAMPSDNSYGQLIELWSTAQKYISQYFKMSISVTYSEIFNDYRKVSEQHQLALNNSVYRLLYGRSSIIGPNDVQRNIDNQQPGYSALLEKKLIDGLKLGSIEAVEETLGKIKLKIQDLSYNNIILSVMQLINSIKLALIDIERSKIKAVPSSAFFNIIVEQLFKFETLDEIFVGIHGQCFNALHSETNVENEKQTILVEVIRDMIHASYMDQGLCLPVIADKLKMSSKHIGKIFIASTQLPVGDYINEVRLVKAAEWLESSSLNVKEILAKIGVENESYFYRLFKKKYGMTPKEYALKNSLLKIQTEA